MDVRAHVTKMKQQFQHSPPLLQASSQGQQGELQGEVEQMMQWSLTMMMMICFLAELRGPPQTWPHATLRPSPWTHARTTKMRMAPRRKHAQALLS
jgi:hypothetical protein